MEKSPKRLSWFEGAVLLVAGLVGTAGAAGAAAPPRPGDGGKDDPMQLVVVITGRLAGVDRLGAGIVVGEGGDRVYIATANHVVRQGGQAAQDLKVRFRARPGELFEATLLSNFDDKLDLAVLTVADAKRRANNLVALPFSIMGDPDALKRGSEVYTLG